MKRILLVDDAAFIRRVMRSILEQNGYIDIEEAQNGLEAIEKYQKRRPDLVILDIVMPEMDGIECLKELKKIDPDANAIMCSTVEDPKTVAEVYNLGVRDFVVKPIDEQRLIESVGIALQKI